MRRLKIILFVFTFGLSVAWSQEATNSAGNPPPPPAGRTPGEHHGGEHHGVLSDADKAELQAAHETAFKADPKLAEIGRFLAEKLRFEHEIEIRPDEQMAKVLGEYDKQLHNAMIKADPKVAPLLDKLEAAHPHRPPPPDEKPPAPAA